LNEGKLFQVETEYFAPPDAPKVRAAWSQRPLHRIEHYWLCDECSSFLTLTFEKGHGMITIPLPDSVGKKTVRALGLHEIDSSQEVFVGVARKG
jgi:hypothetical protein